MEKKLEFTNVLDMTASIGFIGSLSMMLYEPLLEMTWITALNSSVMTLVILASAVLFATDFRNFTKISSIRHYVAGIILAPIWLFIRKPVKRWLGYEGAPSIFAYHYANDNDG